MLDQSPIIRMSGAGTINQVNDTVIGGVPTGSDDTASAVAGQLGKTIWLDPSQIIFQATVGTLFGGRYRYVRYRAADTPAPVVGQIAFWDTTLTNWETLYQVTREEDLSSVDNAVTPAGVFISIPTAGRYCFIQDMGMVPMLFRAVLTSAGAVGSRVYAAGAGDGADEGLADVLSSGAAVTFADAALLEARYMGIAVTAPVATELDNVVLQFKNVIG